MLTITVVILHVTAHVTRAHTHQAHAVPLRLAWAPMAAVVTRAPHHVALMATVTAVVDVSHMLKIQCVQLHHVQHNLVLCFHVTNAIWVYVCHMVILLCVLRGSCATELNAEQIAHMIHTAKLDTYVPTAHATRSWPLAQHVSTALNVNMVIVIKACVVIWHVLLTVSHANYQALLDNAVMCQQDRIHSVSAPRATQHVVMLTHVMELAHVVLLESSVRQPCVRTAHCIRIIIVLVARVLDIQHPTAAVSWSTISQFVPICHAPHLMRPVALHYSTAMLVIVRGRR